VQAIIARAAPMARVVCTLKDAVKLGPRWPAECPPLWYLSQSVHFEAGASHAVAVLDRLVATTAPSTPLSRG
jgi:tetraacyldisaccharide 4'-kinase